MYESPEHGNLGEIPPNLPAPVRFRLRVERRQCPTRAGYEFSSEGISAQFPDVSPSGGVVDIAISLAMISPKLAARAGSSTDPVDVNGLELSESSCTPPMAFCEASCIAHSSGPVSRGSRWVSRRFALMEAPMEAHGDWPLMEAGRSRLSSMTPRPESPVAPTT